MMNEYVWFVETPIHNDNEIVYTYIFCWEKITAERIKKESNNTLSKVYGIERCLVTPSYKILKPNYQDTVEMMKAS